MARVLFTSCPAFGHVLPMLPLVRAATRAGHDVRLATGPDLVGALSARGLTTYGVGPAWVESWAAHNAAWADPEVPEEKRMLDGAVALFGTPALARLSDLGGLAEGWRPDLVVHEVLEVAGALLAVRLGVPHVTHGIGPMFPSYPWLIDAAAAVIGEPELWAHLASAPAVDLCPPSLQPEGPPPWPRTVPVRPSPGEPGAVPPAVAEVLAGDGPVAYLTLGTIKNEDLATGLAALASYDGRVVVTTGGGVELGDVPANAVVAAFVPQAALLARADLVVSHSGSGTMLGALAYGVPQVALPRGTDQPQNAALLARAGAGVVVAPDEFAVDTIRAAVSRVTGDPAYRSAAERVRDEIAAMPSADETLEAL
jgi:UDP:flavonoid glycosyltransferase YjiC (YdhE family)